MKLGNNFRAFLCLLFFLQKTFTNLQATLMNLGLLNVLKCTIFT